MSPELMVRMRIRPGQGRFTPIRKSKHRCPKRHITVHILRQGKHAGMMFCKTCSDWYPDPATVIT